MGSPETNRLFPPDVLADIEEVCRQAASGKIVRDPELLRRVTERSARVQQEALSKYGVQDIGVQIIRDMREREMSEQE
jgi:hypothetical protein